MERSAHLLRKLARPSRVFERLKLAQEAADRVLPDEVRVQGFVRLAAGSAVL